MKSIIGLGLATVAAGALSVALASDDEVNKTFDFTGFEKIEISGVYEIDVRVGGGYAIELSGPESEMSRVDVKVRGNVLDLDQRSRKRGEKRRRRQGVLATISLPSLEAFRVSGVVDGEISGIDSQHFEIEISGVGDIEVAGTCTELEAYVSGVGELDAEDLQCRTVKVRVSGVGEANVYASESVDAAVSGMGDINVYGSPKNVKKRGGLFADISIH